MLSLVTCTCGYPRAVGFACTACTAFDHLPSYHTFHDAADTDAALAAAESEGWHVSPYGVAVDTL